MIIIYVCMAALRWCKKFWSNFSKVIFVILQYEGGKFQVKSKEMN